MNMVLWILQILLALHTAVGAIWKFSNSEQSMSALQVIPHGVWQTMGVIELICSICLILPALNKSLRVLAPVAAIFIALEMVLFTVLHLSSGDGNFGPVIYWLVVAGFCVFIAYGRLVFKPVKVS